MTKLVELTAEEKARPYSKYYYKPLAEPNEELKAAREMPPMDPSKAQLPQNINDFLDPGYFEVETGYCVLPNGAGYLSVNNKMPGVTADMINWWFAWHSLEPLRYKIWYPPGHKKAIANERARKRILDPSTPAPLKFQGITHQVVEGISESPPAHLWINFLTPEDMGFNMKRFHSPNVETVVGGFGINAGTDDVPPPSFVRGGSIMMHFVRAIPDGIEFRTRFWIGYRFVDRKPVCILPPGIAIPVNIPRGLFQHNIDEFSNLRSFLPQIYGEESNNWL
jgi:hypothetical protein